MNTDQQVKQLKEAISSSELMILEQSKFIVKMKLDLDDLQKQLDTVQSESESKIKAINEDHTVQLVKKNEEIQNLQLKSVELMVSTQELEKKNAKLEQEYQKIILDLERQLIDAKLQLAQQSSDFEEAKRDVIVMKKQITEKESSESDKTSNSPNHSLIINEGVDFSTSQFILNDKSMLRDIDLSFKNSAIQKNKEFLKNLNAPTSLTKHDSIDFFSPEQCNLRVLINPEYDSFPVIERNGSIEIDFIPSPQKSSSTIIETQNYQQNPILLTPLKSMPSIEKQQEYILGKSKINRILVGQHQPQIIMLNEKEKEQVLKVLEESSQNQSLLKTYNNEVIPLLEAPCLYQSTRSELVQQKMAYLLRKQSAPQSYRKRIWPQLIGNRLRINKKLYKNLETSMQINPVCQKISNLIREDMHRTYPNFSLFDKGSQTNETLQAILEQFNYFRPDIGYVQGMAYPAALLFLYLGDSYLTFKYFNNLIAGSEFLSNLYKFKIDKIKIYLNTFDFFLSQKYPNCTKHLQKLHIQSDIFLIEWFYTLYCRAFSFATIAKIWDLMLTQGEVVFYKVGISIFGCIEKDLIDKDFDDTLFLIRNCTNKIDPEFLLKQIYSSKLTTEQLFKKYSKIIEEQQLLEKSQIKKNLEQQGSSLNSSSSSASTQSSSQIQSASAAGNSASKSNSKSENLSDQLLKIPVLETIDELNSSTQSAAFLSHNSNDDKTMIDSCITLRVNYDQGNENNNDDNNNSINNKENINQQNHNNKDIIPIIQPDQFYNDQIEPEQLKEGFLLSSNSIQEIVQS